MTANHSTLLTALSQVEPAFGRGESLTVDGQPLDLVLVKNPSGFRLGLKSFSAGGYATMIGNAAGIIARRFPVGSF